MFESLFRSLASFGLQKRIVLDGKQILFGTETIEQSLLENRCRIQFDSPFRTNRVLVLAGLQDPAQEGWAPTGVEINQVTETGFSALVKKTNWQSSQGTTLYWLAMASPVLQITVSWEPARLIVPDVVVTAPTEIHWQTDPEGESFNIVGVFGLEQTEFGVPLSHKPLQSSTLHWFCTDLCSKDQSYFYSILAEKGGIVRFHDPKITNMPGPPGTPPPRQDL